jgi:hypothetical protein
MKLEVLQMPANMNNRLIPAVARTFISFATGLLLLMILVPSVQAQPSMPHQFYGTVTIDSALAGAGQTVTAKIASAQVASGTTDAQGRYGYSPTFMVTGAGGALIEFYVNGVKATQTANCNPGTVTQLNLNVTGGGGGSGSCSISTASLSAGTVGTAYSATLQASGGTAPYAWSVSSGTLPAGLTLNSSTGVISGTPTTAQTYNFSVQANDSASHTCSTSLSILINAAPPAAQTINTNILSTTDTFSLSGGVLTAAKNLTSSDARVRLSFAANTTISLSGQTALGATTESNPPAATDNSTMIRAYSFTPSGAAFSPAATLTLKYENSQLPAGAVEGNLYIAYYTGSAWEKLTSTVNTSTKEVSAPVSHFTVFAIRYTAPAPTTTITTTTTTTTTTTPTTTTTTANTVTASVLGTSSSISVSGSTVPAAASVGSGDGRMSISIAANTTVNLQGSQQLTVVQLATPPSPPASSKVIAAYAFGPDNATFNPSLTVTIKYNTADIPAGVQETDLYIASLSGSTWTDLPSTVNTQNKTVTASISHFSTYALLGKTSVTPPPASTSFTASDLTVTPRAVKSGEQVTVSVRLVNTGTIEGAKTVVLKVNDSNAAQKEITLTPGKSQLVSFTVSKTEPGSYNVSIEGQSASFEVASGGTAGKEQPSGLSIPVMIIIGAGCLLVLILVIVLIVRQRSSY